MRNLLILAKWLANMAGISVLAYNGQTACISKQDKRLTLMIPSSWLYSSDPDAAELLEGIVDHEALGHGRHTDFDVFSQSIETARSKGRLYKSVLNILEDVYIERAAIRTYPGVKKNLASTVNILHGKGFFGTPDCFHDATPERLFSSGLLNLLRYKLIEGQDILQTNAELLDALLIDASGDVWAKVKEVAFLVEKSDSTKFNVDLTDRIFEILESAATQPEPEQDPGQDQTGESTDSDPDSDSNGQDSKVDPTGDVQDSGPDQASEGQDSGQDQSGKGSDSETDPSGQGSGSGQDQTCDAQDSDGNDESDGDDSATSDSPGKAKQFAQEVLEGSDLTETEISEMASQVIGALVGSGTFDDLDEVELKQSVKPESVTISSRMKVVSAQLEEALKAETFVRKQTKLVGRRLNNRVLHRTKLCNARIFSKKTKGEGLSTAVSILVDLSGSMSNDKMKDGVTRETAAIGLVLGLGNLLNEFDVPFEVNCYSDRYAVMKSFDKDWNSIVKSGNFPRLSGGTHTGAAMTKALPALVCRTEAKKLFIVVTDGDTADLDILMSCYSEAQVMGVEIASVMLGPVIPPIQALAAKFGFPSKSVDESKGLGKFATDRILESI